MPLTDATIRNLKPRDKPYKVSDFEGLVILVKPTGSRRWHQKYCIDENEKLRAIGPIPRSASPRPAKRAMHHGHCWRQEGTRSKQSGFESEKANSGAV